jgi:hypothetical protein
MTHDPQCGGCPKCSAEMLSLLSMSNEEYHAWLKADIAKWKDRAMAREREARANSGRRADPLAAFEPPDPYAAAPTPTPEKGRPITPAASGQLSDFEPPNPYSDRSEER